MNGNLIFFLTIPQKLILAVGNLKR